MKQITVVFPEIKNENDTATKISFQEVYLLAKQGNLFINSVLTKPCMITAVEVIKLV